MAKTPAFRLRSAMLIAENTTNGIADTVWMDASFGTSSVAEIADNLDMTLTPNPVNKGSLKVTLGLQNPGKVSIEIYDLHGRKLHEESFTSRNEFTVNVSDLSAGIYYLHLETDGKLISRQFEMLK